jgi:hypothetical protein
MDLGGLSTSDIANLIKNAPALLSVAKSTVRIAGQVAADPYLKETICVAQRVVNALGNKKPGPPCRRTGPVSAAQLKRGANLGKLLPAARAIVFHKKNPWVVPAVAVGTVGLIFWMGYFVGKSKKK